VASSGKIRARRGRKAAPLDAATLMHPELRAGSLAAHAVMSGLPPLSDQALTEFRAACAAMARPLAQGVPVQRRLVAGADGQRVPVYVINARAGTRRPAILHTHGGGFVGGAARIDVGHLQQLAVTLDCVCVTVDYRLAPEATWRESLADNYGALRWLHSCAARLGVDRHRIAVMGESAGGGHAALLAIEARNRGEVPVVLQVLIYPMLDDRTGSSRRVPEHVGTTIWTRHSNRYAWGAFLGMKPGGRKVPSAAVPARVTDLRAVAPAFIGVGALDLFMDEGVAYAQRLNAAGIPAELHVVPGAVHAFDEFAPESSLVRQFNGLKIAALRRAFGIPVD
jgi:acetyl esterase/lipase